MHEEATYCMSCGDYLGYLEVGAECQNPLCHQAVCEKPACLEKCFELIKNGSKIKCRQCGAISPY
ncbi:MAG: hypothetical protein HY730_08020 [Candidatus Tectomicrobia bacterium]|uniref:Uncharacterized protein n=1 Tax=Tectimicrobiota bacterium TaxID=2528274 RepID=A0A933GP64_UNCTE|nr:hypothetical protein [Candidatus Tectomicrobia bacterium]